MPSYKACLQIKGGTLLWWVGEETSNRTLIF